MTAALGIAIILGALAIGWWAYRAGRTSERVTTTERANAAKDKQLDAAADRPRTRGALVERMRGWGK